MFELLNAYAYENHAMRIKELIKEAEKERLYAELKKNPGELVRHRNILKISICGFGCLLEKLGRAMQHLGSVPEKA